MGEALQRASTRGRTEAADVNQTLRDLDDDLSRLEELWAASRGRLEQGVELQRFNQEGDRIETTLSGHEARLRVRDLGVSPVRKDAPCWLTLGHHDS